MKLYEESNAMKAAKIQAQAILDMKLQRLTGLEQDKIKKEGINRLSLSDFLL